LLQMDKISLIFELFLANVVETKIFFVDFIVVFYV
jgi:hypothetical protein